MQTSALTPAEARWVQTQLAIAVELARAYTSDSEDPPSLERLDATWLAWHQDSNGSRTDPKTVVNALGTAFGTHLKDALDLDWAIVTDHYGTDLALYGRPHDVTFFPANMIAKRAREKTPIFTELHAAAVASVKELRSRR